MEPSGGQVQVWVLSRGIHNVSKAPLTKIEIQECVYVCECVWGFHVEHCQLLSVCNVGCSVWRERTCSPERDRACWLRDGINRRPVQSFTQDTVANKRKRSGKRTADRRGG